MYKGDEPEVVLVLGWAAESGHDAISGWTRVTVFPYFSPGWNMPGLIIISKCEDIGF